MRWAIAGLVAVVFAAPLAATAQPRGPSAPPDARFGDAETARRVEELAKEAIELYRQGRYREALVRFKMALALEPVANLLFNVARIYEKLGEPKRAIEYYERFLRAPDAAPAARQRALERIAALRAPPKRSQPPGVASSATRAGLQQHARSLSPVARKRLRAAGWSLVGSGAAVLGTGIAMALLARREQRRFDEALDLATKYDARSRAEGFALATDIAWGVGGAALATGVGLFLYERLRRPRREARLRVEPRLLPSGAALQANVAF